MIETPIIQYVNIVENLRINLENLSLYILESNGGKNNSYMVIAGSRT
jgi:hypothetical protein